jgi:hypothetical protein
MYPHSDVQHEPLKYSRHAKRNGAPRPLQGRNYYLLVAPLPPGPHTITFGGVDATGFSQSITYHLTVR